MPVERYHSQRLFAYSPSLRLHRCEAGYLAFDPGRVRLRPRHAVRENVAHSIFGVPDARQDARPALVLPIPVFISIGRASRVLPWDAVVCTGQRIRCLWFTAIPTGQAGLAQFKSRHLNDLMYEEER